MPHKDRAIPPGSLAELAARSGETEYAEADGIAAAADIEALFRDAGLR